MLRSETSALAPDTRSDTHRTLQGNLDFAVRSVDQGAVDEDTGDRAAMTNLLRHLAAKTRTAAECELAGIQQQFDAAMATMPSDLREAMRVPRKQVLPFEQGRIQATERANPQLRTKVGTGGALE